MTRLDFAIGSSGLMRQALTQAIHHTTNRRAFQRSLADLPIMRNVVADLAVEAEAMMWMSMRLALTLDHEQDGSETLLSRVCTPVAKYWACKRAPQFVAEALECHGGNGFIADHFMERLYREAPLNGIWEGTGNVICLDVLRSMQREPETISAFLGEVRKARGADGRLDAFTDEVERRLSKLDEVEPVARRVVEMMAFALQGSLLVRYSMPAVADAFWRDTSRRRLGSCLRYHAERIGYARDRQPLWHPGGLTKRPKACSPVCPRLALSGHRLVRCTCLFSGKAPAPTKGCRWPLRCNNVVLETSRPLLHIWSVAGVRPTPARAR